MITFPWQVGVAALIGMLPWLWIANILIVIGLWLIGYKWRHAFLFSIAGEAIYTVVAWESGQNELCFICVVFCLLAYRNWIKWSQPSTSAS